MLGTFFKNHTFIRCFVIIWKMLFLSSKRTFFLLIQLQFFTEGTIWPPCSILLHELPWITWIPGGIFLPSKTHMAHLPNWDTLISEIHVMWFLLVRQYLGYTCTLHFFPLGYTCSFSFCTATFLQPHHAAMHYILLTFSHCTYCLWKATSMQRHASNIMAESDRQCKKPKISNQ